MVVSQLAVLHADVACVGYNYCIVDGIANTHAAGRICFLLNADLCCCILCGYRCGCFYLCRIFAALCCRICCYNVHDLACVDVILGYCVCISKLCCLARCQLEGLT